MRSSRTVICSLSLLISAAALCIATNVASGQAKNDLQYTGSLKVDGQGKLRAMYNLSVASGHQNIETAARTFLTSHSSSLGIQDAGSALSAERIDLIPGGSHVRFSQMHRGIPVYGGRVVVSLNARNEIGMIVNTAIPDIEVAIAPAFDKQRAIAIARDALHTDARSIGSPDTVQLMVYRSPTGKDHLAYRVTLTREEPAGDWELLVDAVSGTVLKQDNLFVDYHDGERVQGRGHVYRVDPLSSSRTLYGAPGFADNNNQDSDSLTAQRTLVALDSVTYAGGAFHLRGPFCTLADIESPVDTLPTAVTPDGFSFTRGQNGFEAVNAFYHIATSYTRLRELGFSSPVLEQIRIDPHGFQGLDNSHYSPTGNWISFGTGGVDDAEDADVIWHEYAHAMQFAFAAGWGSGECGALGEGYADYWAASYSRTAGNWNKIDAPYNWVYKWDGHNEFWGGRKLDDKRTYPFGSLSIHSAGQIWSATLMGIWDELGRDITDMLVIKSLFYLGTGATAVDAAHALLQADRDLFGGSHLATLVYWLGTVKGFINPADHPGVSTDVPSASSNAPAAFALDQNYPNPFNPTTRIQFSLAASARITLKIFNVVGQEVATVLDGSFAAGTHSVVWDASNMGGTTVGSSMYIARLIVAPVAGGDPLTFSRKMVLLR